MYPFVELSQSADAPCLEREYGGSARQPSERRVDQPFAEVLTRMAAQRMGRIEVVQTPATVALTVVSVVGIAVIGAIGPARSAVRTLAIEAVRTTSPVPVRRRMGVVRWVLEIGRAHV